jgi:hypothetical protein
LSGGNPSPDLPSNNPTGLEQPCLAVISDGTGAGVRRTANPMMREHELKRAMSYCYCATAARHRW